MVHNLPENFNISDFDVFHSALLDTFQAKKNDDLMNLIYVARQDRVTSSRFQAAAPDSPQATTCHSWFKASLKKITAKDTREAPCRSFGLNSEIADSISAQLCH